MIIGQDPYHEMGQAMGLSFSVPDGVAMPPSLQNIFKEIEMDLGTPMPHNGDLTRWAEQGVLLLNATLTVRAHQANSHQRLGWQTFTDAAIRAQRPPRAYRVHALGRVCKIEANISSTARKISFSRAYTPHRCRQTAGDGSATTSSRAATTIS